MMRRGRSGVGPRLEMEIAGGFGLVEDLLDADPSLARRHPPLDDITQAEAEQYLKEGHFAAGSMKPKVEACLQFLSTGGEEAMITSPERLKDALDGKTGTRIVKKSA